MAQVEVNLGDRSYVITVGAGTLESAGEVVSRVRKPSSAAVVSNPVISRHYADRVIGSLEAAGIRSSLIVIPAGERFKTLKTMERVYGSLLDAGMDRAGAVVALGGGVVGDIAGFAAATYMRGVDCYQVPTSLLAQVDSSVGGKTGVDLPRGKNLVGAFHQPKAVIIDIDTLSTLPVRELRSGLAEVIKHAIIYDQEFYRFLDKNARGLLARDPELTAYAVQRSVEIKRDIVQNDEREAGLRAVLNYGHTVGHAVEVVGGFGRYRHGEALSIGMVAEAMLAERMGVAPRGLAEQVNAIMTRFRLPVRVDQSLQTGRLLDAIQRDKKAMSGELRLALPTQMGKCGVFKVGRDVVAEAIELDR
jgi:3-dehydroquinate synthase